MPYLFQVRIGPVQSLLRGVKRTCDLQFSSSLLNELACVATWTLSEQQKKPERLIFPVLPLEQETNSAFLTTNMPSKILAYIENEIPAENMANQIKNNINDTIDRMCNEIFFKIKVQFDRRGAKLQIADLIEYRWAAISYNRADDNYAETRIKLDALMTARKNTHDFAPVSWGSELPKSSIDGLLESVIPETAYPPSLNTVQKASGEYQTLLKAVYRRKSEALRQNFAAGPHEKLSGVDLLKRLGSLQQRGSPLLSASQQSTQEPPSTSHMAALPFLQGLTCLTETRIKTWRETYFQTLQTARDAVDFALDMLPADYWEHVFIPGEFDSALLYPLSFTTAVDVAEIAQEAQEQFQTLHLALERSFETLGLHPDPYYALLMANGDSLEGLIDYQAQAGIEQHQKLSAALVDFALTVPAVIEKYAGTCIYACGDDVLALLPLHTALQCASELAGNFSSALTTFKDWYERSPTLSAGLAVLHHLHPLGDALAIARQTEKRAKCEGKNALAITLQKLDGPAYETGGTWGVYDQRLERQIAFYQQQSAHAGPHCAANACQTRERVPCMALEQDFLATQSYGQHISTPSSQEVIHEPCCWQDGREILDLPQQPLPGRDEAEPAQMANGEHLAHELLIARLFANARRLARGNASYKGDRYDGMDN